MNHEQFSSRDRQILQCLSSIPKKMLAIHGTENMTEFVLHELCGNCCFNFTKAAYFVDNPDFKCSKGVAGCCLAECYTGQERHWDAPESFSDHMKHASFNQKVRHIQGGHMGADVQKMAHEFARQLEIKNPDYHVWPLKNGNKGLLVFEHGSAHDTQVRNYLESGLSLLSFCPIF